MIQPLLPYNNIYNQNILKNSIQMPQGNRNYILVDPIKVDYFVKQKENALPYVTAVLSNSHNEAEITENLYILDRLIENKTEGIDKIYPILSRFNNTNSPNIQTFLAGIYRKIQVNAEARKRCTPLPSLQTFGLSLRAFLSKKSPNCQNCRKKRSHEFQLYLPHHPRPVDWTGHGLCLGKLQEKRHVHENERAPKHTGRYQLQTLFRRPQPQTPEDSPGHRGTSHCLTRGSRTNEGKLATHRQQRVVLRRFTHPLHTLP